jgi:glutathione S-transferase
VGVKTPSSRVFGENLSSRPAGTWRIATTRRHGGRWDLADEDWVANEITVADLGLYPIYARRKALIDGAGLRNVTAWGERVGARPGVQKGMKLES